MSELQRLLHDPVFRRLGLTLVHFLWQGLAAGLLALLLRALLRHARPAVRYLVLLGLFITMAAAPVLTFTLWTKAPPPTVMTMAEMQRLLATAARQRPAPILSPGSEVQTPARPSRSALLAGAGEGLRALWWRVRRRLPVAGLLWMTGVLALSLRLLLQWGLFVRVVRRGQPLAEEQWQRLLASLCARLGVRRAVRLLQSVEVGMPTAAGWLRPVILLPPAVLLGLTPEQLEAVLAHELAHIRRHDFLVNVFQRVVEVLLFYHPAVWWISGLIRLERELCCDDLAVTVCGDRVTYARALKELESTRAPAAALSMAQAPVTARVRRLLLAVEAGRRPLSWSTVLFPTLALAAIILTTGIVPVGGQPYIRGTLAFQDIEGEGRWLYWSMGGDVARVLSGRSAWEVRDPSPFGLMEYSPRGDEVLFLRPADCPWKGSPLTHPTVVWKAKLDSRGRPDFSRAVNLLARAGLGRGDSGMAQWSPDGSRILFLYIPCGCGTPNPDPWPLKRQLWVVNADGSGAHQIRIPGRVYAHGSAQWAPDGSAILLNAVARLPGDVGCGCATFLVDAEGKQLRRLPPLRSEAISPDGRLIAGVAEDPLLGDLMALTGKGQPPPAEAVCGWQLVLMRPDGTRRRSVLKGSYRMADLPGEAWGAFTALSPHWLVWSPDGQQLAFLAALDWDPKGPPIDRQMELYIYDLPSDRLIRVTHDDIAQCSPVWLE